MRDWIRRLADLTPLSRAVANEQIKEGKVLVNGAVKKAKYTVKEGDIIQYEVPEVEEVSYEAEDLPLDIVYEDQDVVVVNKPQGMVVHPSAGHTSGTLVKCAVIPCQGPFRDQWGIASRDRSSDRQRHVRSLDGRKK